MVHNFRETIGEIGELFAGDLKLDSKGIVQNVRDITKELKSFGNEFLYSSPEADETLSIYMILRNKKNIKGHYYPIELKVTADLESGRLNDVLPSSLGKNIPPFLFEPPSPQHNWRTRYDAITELKLGSDITRLAEILDYTYPTM
jgi:hypothetical protein